MFASPLSDCKAGDRGEKRPVCVDEVPLVSSERDNSSVRGAGRWSRRGRRQRCLGERAISEKIVLVEIKDARDQ